MLLFEPFISLSLFQSNLSHPSSQTFRNRRSVAKEPSTTKITVTFVAMEGICYAVRPVLESVSHFGQLPRVTGLYPLVHRECAGLGGKILKGTINCSQHACWSCERKTAEAGGMLYRFQNSLIIVGTLTHFIQMPYLSFRILRRLFARRGTCCCRTHAPRICASWLWRDKSGVFHQLL
jgi:hypothetical protein